MKFTRDSAILWVGSAAALVGYLIADGRVPTEWTYQDWLKFASAIFGFVMAKLQTSPLKGENDA